MTFLHWAAHELKAIHDILRSRGQKYNSAEEDNFETIRAASRETGIPLEQGVRFMMNLKLSRLNYGNEATDDSKIDSGRDLIGYALMYLNGLATKQFSSESEDIPVVEELQEPPAKDFVSAWKGFLGGKK